MYIGLQVLRAKIRGFNAAGLSIHHHIRKAKGPKRNELWLEKRRLGCYNREHLIAYGLLRGISYERIEHCAKENQPNPSRVFELMMTHGDQVAIKDLTLERIEAILKSPVLSSSCQGRLGSNVSPSPSNQVSRRPITRTRKPLEKGLGS